MGRKVKKIYWAAPLFTQAERIWNKMCAEWLRAKGYRVILPQEEAEKHVRPDGSMDFDALARDCYCCALESDAVAAVLDGPDPDSGTSMEAAFKIQHGGLVIGLRTDFRKAEDGELNAMFRLLTKVIYYSSLNQPYETLLVMLDEELQKLSVPEIPSPSFTIPLSEVKR